MPYLIDSDWLIDQLDGDQSAHALLSRLAPEGIAISIVTYMETFQGVLRSATPAEAERKFRAFIATLPVLPFSIEVAERCAHLRHILRSQNKRVNQRAFDLVNAATALEHGLTLVTRNRRDYDDLPGLSLYEEGAS